MGFYHAVAPASNGTPDISARTPELHADGVLSLRILKE
jgi:hypothetical protein